MRNKVFLRIFATTATAVLAALLILAIVFPLPASVTDSGFLSIGTSYKVLANPDWLTGWDNRVKITVNASYIDSDLTHFPLLLHLSSSCGENSADVTCVFDELQSDANRKKIAITRSDGTTQLYAEIERWDDANEEAWIWVSNSTWEVDDTNNTDLYLYYDKDHAGNTGYVGDTGSTPAQNVWDSNFGGVWHLGARRELIDIVGHPRTSGFNIGLQLARMGNGSLLAVWNAYNISTPLYADILQSISSDNGTTWDAPTAVRQHSTYGCSTPRLLVSGNDTYLLYSRWVSSPGDSKLYLTKSTDYGGTWGTDAYINTGHNYNLPSQGLVKETGSTAGRLVWSFSYWDGIRIQCQTMYSDNGTYWTMGDTIVYEGGSGLDEPGIVELSDGNSTTPSSLYMVCRSDGQSSAFKATALNNDGSDWSGPSTSGYVMGNVQGLLRLGWDPNVVVWTGANSMSVNYPAGFRISTDDCSTWSAFRTFYYNGVGSGIIGHPLPLGDGLYLVPVNDYPTATYTQETWVYKVDESWFWGLMDSTSNGNHGSVSIGGFDTLLGGTASASNQDAGYEAAKAGDNSFATLWRYTGAGNGEWWKVDYSVNYKHIVRRIQITGYYGCNIKDFNFQGSNDDSDWTTLGSFQYDNLGNSSGDRWRQMFWVGDYDTPYRYFRVLLTSDGWSGSYVGITEIELYTDGFTPEGLIGGGYEFDQWSDNIVVTTTSSIFCSAEMTLEAQVWPWALPEILLAFDKWNIGQNGYQFYLRTNGFGSGVYRATKSTALDYTGGAISTSEPTYLSLRYSEAGNFLKLYENLAERASSGLGAGSFSGDSQNLGLGRNIRLGDYGFLGLLDELRFSKTLRSTAWTKATYYSNNDDLLDWGSEETSSPEITNTPGSNNFGILEVNTTSSTDINYFTIENTGGCAVDVVIYGTDATGGDDTWTLSDTATPGENIYGLYAGLDDDDDEFDVIVRKNETYNTLLSDLAEDATQDWGLQLIMPSSLSGYDCNNMTATVTLVASEAS